MAFELPNLPFGGDALEPYMSVAQEYGLPVLFHSQDNWSSPVYIYGEVFIILLFYRHTFLLFWVDI